MPKKEQSPLERKYQAGLIKRLEMQFPGCVILKNDPNYRQGIPDLVIFFGGRHAFLEVKRSKPLSEDDWEPNQQWYLEHLNEMWFASVIYPENEKAVRDDLQYALSPTGPTRVPESVEVPLDQLRRRKTGSGVHRGAGRAEGYRSTQAGA